MVLMGSLDMLENARQFLVKSLEDSHGPIDFSPSLHAFFCRFLQYFHAFPPFFASFTMFSPGFPRPPVVTSPRRPAPRHLQGLAEESKQRIAATGWAWHQVLNVAKEATLQEVKQLDEGNRLDLWISMVTSVYIYD